MKTHLRMVDSRITKKTDKKVLILWEENGEYGNIKIEYTEGGKYEIDAEYIGIDKLMRILKSTK